MKQMILGTPLGRMAMAAHNIAYLLFKACSYPESLGAKSNDQLAVWLVTRMCQPAKYFIDVGAHIGSIISEVIWHDPSIKIIAIEPTPEKASRLRRKFPSVEVHECAVGDREGEATFFVNNKQTGRNSLLRPDGVNMSNITEIKVPITKLDSLALSYDVDVIKIDAEGAELSVLRGSKDLLRKSRPIIMFESGQFVTSSELADVKALWQELTEQGYAVVIPNRVAHNAPGLSQDGFVESHLHPERTNNYFAIPNERRIEIRDRIRKIKKIQVSLNEAPCIAEALFMPNKNDSR